MIQLIENWVANPGGAYITIEGELNGQPIKLTNIIEIQSGTPNPIAFERGGASHHLAATLCPFEAENAA